MILLWTYYAVQVFLWQSCTRAENRIMIGSVSFLGFFLFCIIHVIAVNAYPSAFWDLLVLQLLIPDYSNLPCLSSTFHLEYLSRFCFMLSRFCFMLYSLNKIVFVLFCLSVDGTQGCEDRPAW